MPWPNHTPQNPRSLSSDMEKPRGSFCRSFHPLGVLLLGRCLSTQPRYPLKPKSQPADPSVSVGPGREDPSPDFPCGAATAPCGEATLPDLRDPLRGPGAVDSVSRFNDNPKIERTNHFGQAEMVTSFRAFLFCFATGDGSQLKRQLPDNRGRPLPE